MWDTCANRGISETLEASSSANSGFLCQAQVGEKWVKTHLVLKFDSRSRSRIQMSGRVWKWFMAVPCNVDVTRLCLRCNRRSTLTPAPSPDTACLLLRCRVTRSYTHPYVSVENWRTYRVEGRHMDIWTTKVGLVLCFRRGTGGMRD